MNNPQLIHYNTYQWIVTLCILNSVIIIYKIEYITMHIMYNYNALYIWITLYNALCIQALSKVLPNNLTDPN